MARDAGALLLERFGGPAVAVEHKSTETDLVSEADHAAEELIAATLRDERPDDGLLAEEGASADAGPSGRRWVVDPLDGTVNYLYGHPQWCVSIALEDGDGVALGVVHDPVRGETFTAVRGGGAELGGRAIRIREEERLEMALVATGFAYAAETRALQAVLLRSVLPRVRDIRRGGSAALDMAWLAAGRVDGYYERGLNRWDWAAGRLLVEEAGGVTRALDGDPPGLVAAGPRLIEALHALVRD